MGLDMFLYRVKKVKDYGLNEIYAAERCIHSNLDVETVTLKDPPYMFEYQAFQDFSEARSREIFDDFHNAGAIETGTYGPNWQNIPEDAPICNILVRIHYWRKAYSIDNWIFHHLREGDEEYNGKPNIISKEVFNKLYADVEQACDLVIDAQKKVLDGFKAAFPKDTSILDDFQDRANAGEQIDPPPEYAEAANHLNAYYEENFVPLAAVFPVLAFDDDYDNLGAGFYAETLLYTYAYLKDIQETFNFDTHLMVYRRDY